MDEADVRQKARNFVAKVDVSGIREDLTPYVVAANAKVKKDELGEGESGYTITKPSGKHVITVNSLETGVSESLCKRVGLQLTEMRSPN